MVCIKCGKTSPDHAKFCANCGQNLSYEDKKTTLFLCPYCGAQIEKKLFCPHCHFALLNAKMTPAVQEEIGLDQMQLQMQAAQLQLQKQQLDLQTQQMQATMKCPKCGSISLSGQKKGYGVGKGLVGAAALGTVTGGLVPLFGLIAGNIGSKKVRITCMNCGHKFWAGKGKPR